MNIIESIKASEALNSPTKDHFQVLTLSIYRYTYIKQKWINELRVLKGCKVNSVTDRLYCVWDSWWLVVGTCLKSIEIGRTIALYGSNKLLWCQLKVSFCGVLPMAGKGPRLTVSECLCVCFGANFFYWYLVTRLIQLGFGFWNEVLSGIIELPPICLN